MSVLIKGIDLPKKCGECAIYVCYRTWNGDPGDEFCGITKEDVSRETKPDWCPLKGIIMSEVPERKRGKWLPDYSNNYEERFICSVCGKSYKVDTCMGEPMWDFCPCGAEMRGDPND